MDESGGNCRANNLEEILRPFYQRAREAEVRLARLEAEYKNKKGDSSSDRDELLRNIAHLEAKLEAFQTEQLIKQEKAMKERQRLVGENTKLQYRISHLIRALEEADLKLEGK
ncbi:hypothetical protein AMTR_s00053p00210360 [Amborella trichopoda]|uniref:Uncharacterized protein n=1 Tax=Amborella trichopoda TaxID=13333 RepID=W1PDQ3_AMBTC|nr:hypothetical protein AMTR_s00053p00210360 [Amborella trichopoda]